MANPPSAKVAPPTSPKAPPPTASSLEAYRTSIKRSNDPAAQLEFAKYVLEHAQGIADQEHTPKQVSRRYEMLTTEGLKWVKKLAGGGITVHRTSIAAEAQYFLGTIYSRGIYGVERDDAKAFSYYQHASKAQHAEANYRTAVCYEVGVGIRRDPTRALQFYRKAAAQSNVPAMYKLGVILMKGLLGVAASPREGITWLKRAAENATPECPHGLHELAMCHESDGIPGVIPDLSYARELYIKAGKLGYVPSQVRLGQAYEYGTLGCPIDPRRSIGWYTRAAEKNDSDAELALSGWYLTGAEPFLPQNDVEAYLWARRAADSKLAKAEYAVGYYYECGIGVAHPDVNEAQKWYSRAAQQRNRRAINRLRELKQMGVNGGAMPAAARPRRGKGGSMF
ncbi:HCP-like protein [Coemansia spiralis]|nr:HCP-like protein [Coemansia spiralis]